MRIFLIGFMGSGKTYIGQKLAARLEYDFIDLDEFIEKEEGIPIAKIFEEKGETHFRNLEGISLKKLVQCEKVVVATGGGTPCFFDNMAWMNTHGFTIFLNAPLEILLDRLKNEQAHRPLIAERPEEEWAAFIGHLLEHRKPFYEQAKLLYNIQKGQEDVAENLGIYLNRICGR